MGERGMLDDRVYVYAPCDVRPDRLAEVVAEMRSLGAPTIRVWWAGDHWRALEGSHRLAAAHALGLVPEFVEMRLDDEFEHDFEDCVGRSVRDVLEYMDVLGQGYEFDGLARLDAVT